MSRKILVALLLVTVALHAAAQDVAALRSLEEAKRAEVMAIADSIMLQANASTDYFNEHQLDIYKDSLRVIAAADIEICRRNRARFDGWAATLPPKGRAAVSRALIYTDHLVVGKHLAPRLRMINTGSKTIRWVEFEHALVDAAGRCIYTKGRPHQAYCLAEQNIRPGEFYDHDVQSPYDGVPDTLRVNWLKLTYDDGTVAFLDRESVTYACSCPYYFIDYMSGYMEGRLVSRFEFIPEEDWFSDCKLVEYCDLAKGNAIRRAEQNPRLYDLMVKLRSVIRQKADSPMASWGAYQKSFRNAGFTDPALLVPFREYLEIHEARLTAEGVL